MSKLTHHGKIANQHNNTSTNVISNFIRHGENPRKQEKIIYASVNCNIFVEIEVLTAVFMKFAIFWDTAP
jgi:hypothetical protein